MQRFVVLEHDHPTLHWDLMLEVGEVLWTWRLSAPPAPGEPLEAERTFNHRPLYLDYEGPVSGDRGRVIRWDQGLFAWLKREETEVEVALAGGRLRGALRLCRLHGTAWCGELTTGAGEGSAGAGRG
jgi:hypothetical protein